MVSTSCIENCIYKNGKYVSVSLLANWSDWHNPCSICTVTEANNGA